MVAEEIVLRRKTQTMHGDTVVPGMPQRRCRRDGNGRKIRFNFHNEQTERQISVDARPAQQPSFFFFLGFGAESGASCGVEMVGGANFGRGEPGAVGDSEVPWGAPPKYFAT